MGNIKIGYIESHSRGKLIYPGFYTTDCIIEVPNEVAALMDSYEHAEAAYYLRRYRHKAYYPLDRGDGAEHDILFVYRKIARQVNSNNPLF